MRLNFDKAFFLVITIIFVILCIAQVNITVFSPRLVHAFLMTVFLFWGAYIAIDDSRISSLKERRRLSVVNNLALSVLLALIYFLLNAILASEFFQGGGFSIGDAISTFFSSVLLSMVLVSVPFLIFGYVPMIIIEFILQKLKAGYVEVWLFRGALLIATLSLFLSFLQNIIFS